MATPVIFETPEGIGIECLQSFDSKTKTFTIQYELPDEGNPDLTDSMVLDKALLRFIKNACKPFKVIFKTNAGLEIHSEEMKGRSWEGMTFEKFGIPKKYTIPIVDLMFYYDYDIRNNRCYVIQETKDDRGHSKFVCKTNRITSKGFTNDKDNIYITI